MGFVFEKSRRCCCVCLLQISTEHDWTRGSIQYNWLAQDLMSVNRTLTPWVVLTAHRMMYTTQLKELSDYIVSDFMKLELEGECLPPTSSV